MSTVELHTLSDFENEEKTPNVVFSFIKANPFLIGIVAIGIISLVIGISTYIKPTDNDTMKIISSDDIARQIVVEVEGAVNSPGVYTISQDSRIADALEKAGGLTENADTIWISRTLNKASIVSDGQKIYIPSIDESNHLNDSSANNAPGDQNGSSEYLQGTVGAININTATMEELESLWGIGRVTAQNIIEQRPYSNVGELLDKKVLKQNVYERNKDKMSVF